MRPSGPARGKVEARAFSHCGERDATINLPLTFDPSGELHMAGRVDALFGDARGECDLVIAIDRPSALPATLEAANLATSARVVRQALVIFP